MTIQNGINSPPNNSRYMYLLFIIENIFLVFYILWVFFLKAVRLVIPVAPKSIHNEIVLVTGGANGIGREICNELVKAEPNLTIIIWDVDEKKGKEAVKELEALGVFKAAFFLVDLSSRQQIENGAKNIRAQFGDVTMLFNNVGIMGQSRVAWKTDPALLEKVFQINVMSHCTAMREFLPGMIKRGKGHVIETCSVAGQSWGADSSAYVSSKHAVKAYVECIKEDLRLLPQKPEVTVTTVFPTWVKTDMTKALNFRSTKYPFLGEHLTAETVAKRIVKGVRLNEEHIYIPGYFRIIPLIMALIPSKVFQRLTDSSGCEYNKDI